MNALGVLRLLEAVRICNIEQEVRIYQASTSEMYGKLVEMPQRETTAFYPKSPYSMYTEKHRCLLRNSHATVQNCIKAHMAGLREMALSLHMVIL